MQPLTNLLQSLALIDWDDPWRSLSGWLGDPIVLAVVGAVAAVVLILIARVVWLLIRRFVGLGPTRLLPRGWWRGRDRRRASSPPPAVASSRAVALVIGDAAGGGNLDLVRAELPRDPAADTGGDRRWQVLRRIALLDTTDIPLVAAAGEAGSPEEEWDGLIGLLLDWRPTRPVDAVVLSVAASRLTGPEALEDGGLAALGEGAARRIARLQERAGRRLPVYVVVAGYDAVPGFDALVHHVVGARRGQTVGWSNAQSLDATYDGALIDDAVNRIAAAFESAQPTLLLARDDGVPDRREAVLALGAVTRALAAPLRRVLTPVFQESAARDVPWLRGIYASGSARPDSRVPRASVDDASRPILLADLFDGRIADEVGIAAPSRRVVARQRLRRNRSAAIFAGLALATLAAALLGWRDLDRSTAAMTSTIRELDAALAAPSGTASERAVQATRMTAALTELDRIPSTSVFNPVSLLFGLDGVLDPAVSDRLAHSVGPQIVSDAFRRSGALLQTPTGLSGDNAVAAMTAWIADALAVEQDVQTIRAARLETLTVDPLAVQGLLHRTYRVKLPLMSPATARRIAAAVGAAAEGVRFDLAGVAGRLGPKIVAAAPALARPPGTGFAVVAQLEKVNRTLARVMTARADPAQVVSGTARRLSADLDSLAETLAGSGSATADELALAALLPQVRKSLILGEGAADALGTALDGRATAVAGAISPFRYPVAPAPVPLLAGNDDGGPPALSPPVAAFRTQLASLTAADFFRPASGLAIRTVLADGTFMNWEAEGLQAVLDLYGDYDAFVASLNDGGGDLTPELRSALTAMAGRGLVDAMDARLATAQTITRPVAPGDAAAEEAALGAAAVSLQGALVPIQEVQGVLLKFQNVSTAGDFAAANRENAAAILDAADRVYHRAAGTQYDPEVPWSLWDGGETATTFAYRVGNASALANYLAAARGRVSTVARSYAQPAVAYLRNGASALSPGEQATLTRWNATLVTLTEYENGVKRGNTLGELESFFASPLLAMTGESCLDDLAKVTPPPVTDLFSQEFATLLDDIDRRCAELDEGQVEGNYDKIVSLFENDLSSYFPFAPAASPNAPPSARRPPPPIPPETVRAATSQLASVLPEARKELAFLAKTGARTADAAGFLDRLKASLDLLGALVPQVANGPVPAVTVAPSFRLDLAGAAGADQVLEWTVTAGSESAVYPIAVSNLAWALGTPVSVAFRWPKNGPVAPASGNGYSWSDRSVTFAPVPAGDPWSLLRLMLANQAPASAFALAPKGRDPNTLAFKVATNRSSADAAGNTTTRSQTAQLYIALGLTGRDATGKEVPLVLPNFPVSAPALPSQPTATTGG